MIDVTITVDTIAGPRIEVVTVKILGKKQRRSRRSESTGAAVLESFQVEGGVTAAPRVL